MTRDFEITELTRFQDAVERPWLVPDRDLTDYCGIQADLLDDGSNDPVDHDLLASLEAQQVDDSDVPF